MDNLNRLKNYETYGIHLDVADGTYIVSLSFPSSWVISKPKTNNIEVLKSNKQDNLYHYMMLLEYDINDIFDSIDNTINFNNELSLKKALFLKKVDELDDLFHKTSYEQLEKLEFTFSEKVKRSKPKKTTTKKKKEEDVICVNEEIEKKEKNIVEKVVNKPTDIDKKIEEALKAKNV